MSSAPRRKPTEWNRQYPLTRNIDRAARNRPRRIVLNFGCGLLIKEGGDNEKSFHFRLDSHVGRLPSVSRRCGLFHLPEAQLFWQLLAQSSLVPVGGTKAVLREDRSRGAVHRRVGPDPELRWQVRPKAERIRLCLNCSVAAAATNASPSTVPFASPFPEDIPAVASAERLRQHAIKQLLARIADLVHADRHMFMARRWLGPVRSEQSVPPR